MGRMWLVGLAAVATLGILGCRSAFVEAALVNRTAAPISVLEVDYPSASFGTQMLAPGATFHYRFKVLGNGPMKLTYTDAERKEHVADGPSLKEGAQGVLTIVISPAAVDWQPKLTQQQ